MIQDDKIHPGVLYILVHLLILLVPNLCLISYSDMAPLAVVFHVFLALTFLALLLIISPKRWVIVLLLLPFYAAVPFEIEYLRKFGELPSPNMVASIFETDLGEITELAGGFYLTIVAAFGLVAVNILLVVFVRASQPASLPRSLRAIALIALIALLFFARETVKQTFPYATMQQVAWYAFQKGKIYNYQYATRDYSFDVIDESGIGEQVHILVIGEASRPQNWGIYGYHRDTTPQLTSEPNIITFSDTAAIAAYTRVAVPSIITRVRADTYSKFIFSERSVIDAFAEAGYKTYWLSNQKRIGKNDTLATAMASRASELHFFNINYHSKSQLDGRLMKPLKEALRVKEERKFIVLHLRGSHWIYSRRYPEEFNVFQPSLDPDLEYTIGDPLIRTETLNSYDNSILYTDHILAEIITMLRENNVHSTITFVADHGENLLDDGMGLSGHGSTTIYDMRIPFLVWLSDSYSERFPEVQGALIANREKKISQDNVFFTLLDLAKVRHRFEDAKETLSSPAFEERDRKILTGSMEILPFSSLLDNHRSSENIK